MVTKIAFYSLIILLLIITSIALFINLSPQFGGSATKEQMKAYEKTGHYKDGKFINVEEFSLKLDCHSLTQIIKKLLNRKADIKPKREIDILPFIKDQSLKTKITWLGHSSFLIEIKDKVILLDPVFSNHASPHPLLGVTRYYKKMPLNLDDLQKIDYVVISHDHYDHLDYKTIDKIKNKVSNFIVPLGVGNHLRKWKINHDKISEFDWWQEKNIEEIKFVFTPSQHMSGRGLMDQKATLWGSWIIQTENEKIYFSGDSGYGSHFRSIGKLYGPFDVALMECGQYDKLWPRVHMMPEQMIQASLEVKAKFVIPIHWGAFTLANHSWTDPIERALKEAHKKEVQIATPQIGETIFLNEKLPNKQWWRAYLDN